MPRPDPRKDRPARTDRRRRMRALAHKLRPVATVLQIVYYAVRLVHEL
ncbi:hypothetical protein [Streptomyces fuscichromogenes]|uniref:Uncharacterized protein n=1 Tax=Streptomyces fuscichromogenes TaxID=1324013 RepID=A0A917XNP1_9ACTN|nr:hypothetical protein [Streptomyces fuscichromogenes]GGN40855.1 hypothetical protein GCM10011578_088520 [Streptomyces fuscichromogenes]